MNWKYFIISTVIPHTDTININLHISQIEKDDPFNINKISTAGTARQTTQLKMAATFSEIEFLQAAEALRASDVDFPAEEWLKEDEWSAEQSGQIYLILLKPKIKNPWIY